jgi:putative sigma-54 modulation protein
MQLKEVSMSRKSKAAEFAQDVWDISVTGRNVQITDAMKSYAIEKVSKIEKFSDRILDVQVTMDIQKLEHRCDIIIKVDHIKIKSHAVSNQMYTSIDMAVHKLETQLLKYKRKIQEHQARPSREEQMLVNIIRAPLQATLEEINDQIEDENIRRESEKYRIPSIVNTEKRFVGRRLCGVPP